MGITVIQVHARLENLQQPGWYLYADTSVEAGPSAGLPFPRMQYSSMPTIPSSYPPRLRQRLTGFDYTTPGFYFVTLCIQDRLPLLGSVVSAEMQRSPPGDEVHRIWEEIPHRYPGIELDTLMVMPDYLHALLSIGEEHTLSLSAIVHHLKARTTAQYAHGVRELG